MADNEIWFWQLIISPHMAGLARELANNGKKVVYVAKQHMSAQRATQGWQPPSLGEATLRLAPTLSDAFSLAERAPPDAIHIFQGIRGNEHISQVQQHLVKLRRRQWVVMETVDDEGWLGTLKRLTYRYLFARLGTQIEGVLATGYRTRQWVIDRGMPAKKVYPFAYFLDAPDSSFQNHDHDSVATDNTFKLLFVGQFIERKRLDLLITAMASVSTQNVELLVVGSGPLETVFRSQAEEKLGGRLRWVGRLPMSDVHKMMGEADCLVLPSRYDGWGAVVVEALMAGTPAICSDRCGSAEAVIASKVGGVFRSGDVLELTTLLDKTIQMGKQTASKRRYLADWARCFSASAGAVYLLEILNRTENASAVPTSPWEKMQPSLPIQDY
ncbi:glycosyltransferase [Orrella marina]|uniref:Glycosyl transferase family 1 domain-containing protein n=1 Tax=Orrella marina TaxID=2163011 RepID=A0A2R4XGU2_9BURK|nr:glycosyltransferase [Orrella marina]AWB33030.1 hypothetical protein DBV39_04070 [Orrella marina]